MSELFQCYNKGCLQKFNPAENTDKSCVFHPGQPVFHDVYKTWSCCKKKTTDFTEFLSTKGCTSGPHNPEKPLEMTKPVEAKTSEEADKIILLNAPKPSQSAPRIPSDHPMKKLSVNIAPSLQTHLMKNGNCSNAEAADAAGGDGKIPVGTQCKRPACMKLLEKNLNPDDPCWYHSGTAVFHEGCTRGRHCWTKEDVGQMKVASCRHDWHQTGADLYVTIYSKCPDPNKTVVECNEVNLKAHVEFEGGQNQFDLEVPLWGAPKKNLVVNFKSRRSSTAKGRDHPRQSRMVRNCGNSDANVLKDPGPMRHKINYDAPAFAHAIDTENSSVHMSAAKVEVKMKKKQPIPWPALMFK